MAPQDRYPLSLLAVFAIVFVALGIAPADRVIWFAESVPVFIALTIFALTYRNLRFSNLSYTALFVFLVLHMIGAHYTYSAVPVPDWFERNHYDRFVHFMYGILMAPLAVELFAAKAPPRGVWVYLLPVLFLTSHGTIFEILEWATADFLMDERLMETYLSMQDDVWDAQKDMLMAMIGAAIGVALVLWWQKRVSRP